LAKVRSRIGHCSEQLSQLEASTRAVTVFAPAKYPSCPDQWDCSSVLLDGSCLEDSAWHVHPEIKEDVTYRMAHSIETPVLDSELSDELGLLAKLLNTSKGATKKVEVIMEEEGLGPIPSGVTSVGALLLFDSKECPYHQYQHKAQGPDGGATDFLSMQGAGQKAVQGDSLANAPHTLTQGDILPEVASLDLSYKPQLGEGPSLDLPSNLPLPNVANFTWDTQETLSLPSIAPSAFQGTELSLPDISQLPSLPEIASTSAPPALPDVKDPPPVPNIDLPPPSSGANLSVRAAEQSAIPPPPPPAVVLPNASATQKPATAQTHSEKQLPHLNEKNAPSPAPNSGVAPPLAEAKSKPPSTPQTSALQARSDLMSAIKNSGIGSLRKVDESIESRPVKPVAKPVSNEPVTLMDELQARMKRRFQIMSGNANPTKASAAAVVPPPQAQLQTPKLPQISSAPEENESESDISSTRTSPQASMSMLPGNITSPSMIENPIARIKAQQEESLAKINASRESKDAGPANNNNTGSQFAAGMATQSSFAGENEVINKLLSMRPPSDNASSDEEVWDESD